MWDETKNWNKIKRAATSVIVRINVFDQDIFTSECIGTLDIPLIDLAADSWKPLERAEQMSEVRGRVRLKSSLRLSPMIAHAANEPGTFSLEILGPEFPMKT